MSTTAKAADNGGTTTTTEKTEKTVPAQREHGLDRLREDECYHPDRTDPTVPQRG